MTIERITNARRRRRSSPSNRPFGLGGWTNSRGRSGSRRTWRSSSTRRDTARNRSTTSSSTDRRGWARRRSPTSSRRSSGAQIRTTSGPGHRARRRPCRGAHQPEQGRRAVHRRDSPAQPRGGGDPLSGHGGLRAGRGARQGSGGADRAAADRARHGHRRHHAGRFHHRAAARPLRRHLPPRLLHPSGPGADPAPQRRHPGDRPGARGCCHGRTTLARARRASRTGC